MIAEILSNYSFLKFFVVSKSVDESRHILVGRKIQESKVRKEGCASNRDNCKERVLILAFGF
jgi:hypothetical protein